MSSCFSCGKGFNGDTNALIMRYKKEYEEKGVIRYFYKTQTNGSIKIVRESGFKTVFQTEIKPNFEKGAEYAHIEEFRGI